MDTNDIEIVQVYHWTDLWTVVQWMNAAQKKQQVIVADRIWGILDF